MEPRRGKKNPHQLAKQTGGTRLTNEAPEGKIIETKLLALHTKSLPPNAASAMPAGGQR